MRVTCQLESLLRTGKSDSHQERSMTSRTPFKAHIHHISIERKSEEGLSTATNNHGYCQNTLRFKLINPRGGDFSVSSVLKA